MGFENLNLVIWLGIAFGGALMAVLSMGILTFGKLISKTPDLDELEGIKVRTEKDKAAWHSPEKMPKLFVKVFWGLFIIGASIMLITSYIGWIVIGSIVAFMGVFFAAMMLYNESQLYNRMKSNERDFKSGIKVVRIDWKKLRSKALPGFATKWSVIK